MGTELTSSSFDLAHKSLSHVLAVMFPKSKAQAYEAVVALCKGADFYAEVTLSGTLYHCAAFGKTLEQVTRAASVVSDCNPIRGTRFFAKGFPILDGYRLYDSLKCYIQSQSCRDQRAYCNRIVSNLFEESHTSSEKYLFPCSLLVDRQARLDLSHRHPASIPDQIEAMAVRLGCDWCPNLRPGDFKRA